MIEATGNLWTYNPGEGKILRCVTTNGILGRNKHLVMGAGVARQARDRFPDLARQLGDFVGKWGNNVCVCFNYQVASFPTKHHWQNPSDPALIEKSAKQICDEAEKWDYVLLTRPGCGLGRLEWKDVKPILEKYFVLDKYIVLSPK
jgi:hypothetical protein